MTRTLLVVFCLCVSHLVHTQRRSWFMQLSNETMKGVPKIYSDNEKNLSKFKTVFLSAVHTSQNFNKIMERGRKLEIVQEIEDDSVSFPCQLVNPRSETRPSSVHLLRPGDVDIIAAMGDSLTAANGALAMGIPFLLVQNRGISALAGGQGNWRQFLTLPNILKEFNPRLIGYSKGDSCTHHENSGLNLAELGAMSQDLPFMARKLVKRINNSSSINDWKLITVFIGPNNFCSDICFLSNASTSVDTHKNNLMTAFRYLRDNLPRTIVIFIQTINMKALTELKRIPPRCRVTQLFECSCLFALQFHSRRKEFFEALKGWHRVDEEVAHAEEFREKEDFAIVLIPFTKFLTCPQKRDPKTGKLDEDLSYFSYDCFHFSQRGNAKMAQVVWNSMMLPEGSVTTNWPEETKKFRCPSENFPYIFTWKNNLNWNSTKISS